MSVSISLTVNGRLHEADVPDNRLLLDYLRQELGLTGTHTGCETSQCGACTVHLEGAPVKACTLLVAQCDGAHITTIEGLADGEALHPMQQAFHDCHGLQCGYCTPGMVMAAIGIVKRHGGTVSRAVIADELDGNLCRCTGYQHIVDAIAAGAKAMAAMAEEAA